MLPQSSP